MADGVKLIEELTRDADQVQERVLQEILKRNAGTEYLQQFLQGQINKELFIDKVPVVDYENVSPYIERIANRDRSQILIAEPIIELFKRQVDGLEQGKRIFFISTLLDSIAPGGLVLRNVISNFIKNKKPIKAPFNWFNALKRSYFAQT